jgi:hemolysin III
VRTTSRTWIKDPFSAMSHMVGALLSLAGLAVLLMAAHGRPWHTVAFAVYGLSLVALYTSSAIYHAVHADERAVRRLQKLDFINIFLLIAGSYTPICLVALRGAWGWTLLGIEWGLAVVGITLVASLRKHPDWVRVALYIVMGWLAILAISPLRAALPPAAIRWLLAGGLAYSGGVVFYATERPRIWPGKFEGHDIWHLFVMGGSFCHFMLMFLFLT